MPRKAIAQKAKRALRSGKKASTAAGEFVGDEIHRQKRGRGAARSRKQAIAIGLSKARKAGVRVKRKTAKSKTARKRTVAQSRAPRRKTAKRKAPARGRRTTARSVTAKRTKRRSR